MCSVSDDFTDVVYDKKQQSPTTCDGFCVKCKASVNVISIKSDEAFCRACFLMRSTHKFRSEFGKSRLIRDNEKVLVAYSGGLSSSALLHLVQEGLSKRAMKKLRFSPTVVYLVDKLNSSTTEKMAIIENVARKLHSTELPFYIYNCGQGHECCELLIAKSEADSTFSLELALSELALRANTIGRSSLESVKTETSKQSLVHLLKNHALANIARLHGIGKVIVGDISNRLAVRIISYIAQGRGDQLPCEMSFADDRNGDVVFVRPMRDFTARELEVYCNLNDIESIDCHQSGLKEDEISSIESLSKDFVLTLQSAHDNTVPIICRTAEKLVIPVESRATDDDRCLLCKAVINNGLPSMLWLFNAPNTQSLQSAENSGDHLNHEFSTYSVASRLCYGCRRIEQDMTSKSELRALFINNETLLRSIHLQNVIKDCIIADDELG